MVSTCCLYSLASSMNRNNFGAAGMSWSFISTNYYPHSKLKVTKVLTRFINPKQISQSIFFCSFLSAVFRSWKVLEEISCKENVTQCHHFACQDRTSHVTDHLITISAAHGNDLSQNISNVFIAFLRVRTQTKLCFLGGLCFSSFD